MCVVSLEVGDGYAAQRLLCVRDLPLFTACQLRAFQRAIISSAYLFALLGLWIFATRARELFHGFSPSSRTARRR